MKALFAKLKGGIKNHRLVLAENAFPDFEILPLPDVSAAEEYAPLQTDILPGTWFYVTLDPPQIEKMVDPYSDNQMQQVEVIDQAEYAVVDTIYKTDGQNILFARIAAADRIHENGSHRLEFKEHEVRATSTSFALDLDGQVDAFYDGSAKRIYFQAFAKAKPFFKGFDIFHQELTLDEKQVFLDIDFFAVGDFNINFISLNDTKKLAAIREAQEINLDDQETQNRIRTYVKNYPSAGVGINDDGKLIIGSKQELSATLKLLEQKFYTSEITGEKFVAGSIKRMAR